MLFFTATSKYNVLLAELNLLYTSANTVCTGGTGRANTIIHTFDFGTCGQASDNTAAHRLGHHIRANATNAFFGKYSVTFFNILSVEGRRHLQ